MKMYKTLLLFLPVFILQCAQEPAKPAAAETKPDPVKRGEYLVTISGCEDCHSPKIMTDHGPAPDPKLRYSGHPAGVPLAPIADPKVPASGQWIYFHPMTTAAVGPWGTSFAANLTPDETGLGNWSYEQFKKALTEGKAKGLDGGRMLLPPMPWVNYVHMQEEDIAAIYAFLKSVPAVRNVVPAPIPPAM